MHNHSQTSQTNAIFAFMLGHSRSEWIFTVAENEAKIKDDSKTDGKNGEWTSSKTKSTLHG